MGPYQQKKGQFSRSCYLGCKQGYVAYTKGKAVLAGSKEQPDGRKSEVLNCLSMSQCRHGPHGKCSLIFDPLTSWHPNTTADPVVALMSGFFLSCNHLSVGISPPEHFYTRWPDYCSGWQLAGILDSSVMSYGQRCHALRVWPCDDRTWLASLLSLQVRSERAEATRLSS
jgi:hypothetical protein